MADKDSFELVTALRETDIDSKPEFVAFHGRHIFAEHGDHWYLTAGGKWAVVDSDNIITYGNDPDELLEDSLDSFPVYERLAAAMGRQPTMLDI